MWLQMSSKKLKWWEPVAENLYRVETKSDELWVIRNNRGTIEATRRK